MRSGEFPPDPVPAVCWVEGPTVFWADELPDLEAATRLSWMAGRWAAWAGDNPDKPWMREREAGWTRLASLAAGGLEIGQTSPHPDGWSHRG